MSDEPTLSNHAAILQPVALASHCGAPIVALTGNRGSRKARTFEPGNGAINGQASGSDPFAPLPGAAATCATVAETLEGAETWEPMVPAPNEPPEAAQVRHPAHGTAALRWIYYNHAGTPLFAVVRFNLVNPDGTPKRKKNGKQEKETLPY